MVCNEINKAFKAAVVFTLAATVTAQASCDLTAESHPSLTWQECSSDGTCTDVEGSVTVDANWRWTHDKSGSTNCYTGNEWDASLCPDDATCTENCCIDGADYESTYGVTASGSTLTLDFVTGSNVGSRLYLLANDSSYQGFTLLGNEFTFDVDVSKLPCGLNGALYFVSMDLDGGASAHSNAGAGYGCGYCDSQCPRDLKFVAGTANVDDWTASDTNSNTGVGGRGACCAEMDIWEANMISTALTPHPCTTSSYHGCSGDNCGGTYSSSRYAGDCDPDGCDFNPFRQGNESFYGAGQVVDTSSTITVVTQFVEESGALSAIKRYYVQNGVVIANSESTIEGNSGHNSITSEYCSSQKTAFGDDDIFSARGGLSGMGDALAQPMVLVLSLWDDYYSNMLWLDSTYPTNETGLGTERGTCSTDSGVPATLESTEASSSVVYSNIKFGPIGSTFDSSGISDSDTGSGSTAVTASSPASSSQATAAATLASSVTTSSAEVSTASDIVAAVPTSSTGSSAGPETVVVSSPAVAITPSSSGVAAVLGTPAGSDVAASTGVNSSAAAATQSATKPKTCKRKKRDSSLAQG